MALRWRIRHKLMLGLVLVVGIMALLLAGTLRGLWGFYLTTNIIRQKLNELKAAEDLKVAVSEVVAPQALASLRRFPPDLNNMIASVSAKLDEYERQLRENLSQRSEQSDHGDDSEELGLLGVVRQKLEAFQKAVSDYDSEPSITGPDRGPNRSELDPDDGEVRLAAGLFGDLALSSGTGPLKLAAYWSKIWTKPDSPAQAGRSLSLSALDLHDGIHRQLETHLSESRRHYQVALWIIVPSSSVGLLLMAGLMCSFYAWVFFPIRDLEAGVKRVAHGDFDHRIDVRSGDEMEDLGAAFNEMMKRLHDLYSDLARQVNERSRQLVRSERLASVGFLAAGVAHEINNPLASIAFCSEALEARLADLIRQGPHHARSGDEREVFAKYLKMIQEEAFRCKSITERLLAFSRTGERKRELTDLGQLVQSVLDIAQHLQNFRGKQIAFEKIPERGGNGKVQAPVSAEEIKSVVLNLVVNALDSMEEGGKLTIQLTQKDGMAEMRFADTGCGMTQEVLENIFEPFFTRSRTGKGTGLGLTISHRIINQHGGEIEAASPGPSKGSTFTVRLPLQYVETPAPAAGDSAQPTQRSAPPAVRLAQPKAA